jgi:hypothetical protein
MHFQTLMTNRIKSRHCDGLRPGVDLDLVARPLQNLFARITDDRLSGGGTGNLLVASKPGFDHVLVELRREQRLPLPLSSPPGSGDEPLG